MFFQFSQSTIPLTLTFAICMTCMSGFVARQKCSTTEVYTHSDSEYIFSVINLNPINLWDGPRSKAAAPTTMTTTGFTKEELKYYNWFSAAMYCPYTLPDLSCCYCHYFNHTVTSHSIFANDGYGTKAMVSLHPTKQEIVVSLRGSVVLLNWIMDFYLLPTKPGTIDFTSSGVKIHRGFYLSTMSIYNEVVIAVGRHLEKNPDYRVIITGHSLGASMASLFIYFLTSLNQFPGTEYGLVTFGQMRTGNKPYVDYMNSLNIPVARVVARADIIPHIVPVTYNPMQILLGVYYLHHGQEVWINGKTTTFCSTTKYEDPTCSNRMGPLYALPDHQQYFAADYTACYYVEGWFNLDLISLPIGWTPTTYIPPMPKFLQELASGVVQGGYQGLLPLW